MWIDNILSKYYAEKTPRIMEGDLVNVDEMVGQCNQHEVGWLTDHIFTHEGILKAIKQKKPNTSGGCDKIKIDHIKPVADILAAPFAYIFNRAINERKPIERKFEVMILWYMKYTSPASKHTTSSIFCMSTHLPLKSKLLVCTQRRR